MPIDHPRHRNQARHLKNPSRVVLLSAFGVLLALLAVGGLDAWSILEEVHRSEEAARLNFLSRSEPLVRLQSTLTLYGDLITKPNSVAAPGSIAQSRELMAQMRSALVGYPPERRADEQALFDRLLRALTEQANARALLLSRHDTRAMEGSAGKDLLPTHLRVVGATSRIAMWNSGQLRRADAELVGNYKLLRTRLKRLLIVLLGSGLAISLASLILIGAQDKEIRKRYSELEKNHEARVQLSARLLHAQEDERLAISRELHDEVSQALGALLVDMGRLSATIPEDNAAAHEEIRKIRLLTESSVSSVRNIALLLRPSMLDDLGLIPAVEWQAREVSRRSDVEVEVEADEIPPLPEQITICIYRVIQEALNNVARHSGASRAWVRIEATKDSVEASVRDNGTGFDTQRTRGVGLLGMEERITLLKGSLRVDSTPGSGTTITARLPLP